jgi:FtsZ-interacting cell division protein ZipA
MSSLRWTLLILGGVFVALLAWWERRRPRQASARPQRSSTRESVPANVPRAVRDPPLTLPEMRARELPVIEVAPRLAPAPLPEVADDVLPAGPEEYGPRTVPDVAEPDLDGAPADAAPDVDAAPDMDAAPPRAPPAPREALPELAAAPPPVVEWPPDQQRRILALRLVAPLAERFAGRSLRQALAAEGFVLGPFAIFHKPNEERRAVLSAASLTRPGTFDMDTMDSQHYGGLSLFAVLPGPKPPPQAFEELVFTARNLSERLHGVLQDEHGSPLTAARIALLREQLRSSTAAS